MKHHYPGYAATVAGKISCLSNQPQQQQRRTDNQGIALSIICNSG